jgi:hypothetical protein
VYKYIRENGGYDKWKFEVIQRFPCDNEEQLIEREQYYYDLMKPLLNTYRPLRTEDRAKYDEIYREKHTDEIKNYREKHKDEMKKYNAKYREEDPEYDAKNYQKRREEINQKNICDCGKIYTFQHKARHCDSKRHINFIKTQLK